jgi:hypothetical protein
MISAHREALISSKAGHPGPIIQIKDIFMIHSNLHELQRTYKLAVEKWIAAIKHEEALASVQHSVAKLDRWEQARFREDEIRAKMLEAKRAIRGALRKMLFGF